MVRNSKTNFFGVADDPKIAENSTTIAPPFSHIIFSIKKCEIGVVQHITYRFDRRIGVITQMDSPWFPRGSPEGAPQILI